MPTRAAQTFSPFPLMFAVAACVFSVDIYIPSLPTMTEWFGSSQEMMQFSISVGLIGTSLSTPIIGPLSDAIGRKQLLIALQLLYTVACFATIFSPNIESFIFCRFIQGIGGAAPIVLSFAIIADQYEGAQAAKYMSYLTSTITSSLVIAPLIGGVIANYYPWHIAFVFLTTFSCISCLILIGGLKETLKRPTPFSLHNSLRSYATMFSNRRFMVMAIIPSIMIGGLIMFMATGAFYFINEKGLSTLCYGMAQGSIMLTNTLGSHTSPFLIERWGLKKTTVFGLAIFAVGSSLFLSFTLLLDGAIILTIGSVCLYAAGLGIVFNTLTAQSMALFKQSAGTVSAAISFSRGLLIATCVSSGSFIYNGQLWPTALFLSFIMLSSIVMYFLIERQPKALYT